MKLQLSVETCAKRRLMTLSLGGGIVAAMMFAASPVAAWTTSGLPNESLSAVPLSTFTAVVGHPVGSVDQVKQLSTSQIEVRGWAANPLQPGGRVQLQVNVVGPKGTKGTRRIYTGTARPDVARAYRWAGANQGFRAVVPALGVGTNTVRVDGIDAVPPLNNSNIGRRTLSVLAAPAVPATPIAPWGPYGALGSYKPDAAHSGVPAGTVLSRLYGDQIITVPGTVIQNKEIFGNVIIRAANVTIKRTRIWGTTAAPIASGGIVNCGSSACVNALIEDSTIRPQRFNYLLDGVQGHDYTVRRSDISGTVDGFGVMNMSNRTAPANVHIEGNYVHGLAYRATPTTIHADKHTHNDGVQIHGNGSVWLEGNNIMAFTDPAASDLVNPYGATGNQVTGQAIALTPILGSITNVHINDNWIDGGAEGGVHAVVNAKAASNIGEIRRNHFGTNQRTIRGVKYTVRVAAALTVVLPLTGSEANKFTATGLPVTVVRD